MNHGKLVWHYFKRIISGQWDNMKIPDWLNDNHMVLVSYLPDIKVLKDYAIYHDCGKHLVKQIDENGRVHYPDHANVSADYWSSNNRDKSVEKLIRNDMFFHICSAKELEESIMSMNELVALLLMSLAEIHANAELFGGIESTSFKIKYKQINVRGKKLCGQLYKYIPSHVYVFIRNDLPITQKGIQGCHSVIESVKKSPIKSHPSLVFCKIKTEYKLKKVIEELMDHGINCTIFRDNIFNDQITAVATEPITDQATRDLLKRFTLL